MSGMCRKIGSIGHLNNDLSLRRTTEAWPDRPAPPSACEARVQPHRSAISLTAVVSLPRARREAAHAEGSVSQTGRHMLAGMGSKYSLPEPAARAKRY
ncbi:hypothetical protein NDU88_011814 [Pleurodeles waltl]|uniref:Uncharacterized protein n=1 Tax=Pleurodeles waltl TaxID=8319 RepID=A0AAV7R437_PLEWA|nr:hypothetical protein NDU88_011814 [Pleurodeles waltl]